MLYYTADLHVLGCYAFFFFYLKDRIPNKASKIW